MVMPGTSAETAGLRDNGWRPLVRKVMRYLPQRLPFTSEVDHSLSSHVTGIILIGLLVVTPFFFSLAQSPVDGTHRLAFHGFQLPGTCVSREVFGVRCPGCGLSRSFVALAHGDWTGSFAFHRVGPIVYLYLCALVVFHGYGAFRHDRKLSRALVRAHHWGGVGMISLLLGNWLYSLIA